jgi:hypothetical protein
MKISLDPSAGGKLFRPGLSFLLTQLFVSDHPRQPTDLVAFAEKLAALSEEIIRKSPAAAGLNLSDEDDARKAFEKLKENRDSREWHAASMGAFCHTVSDAIKDNDALKSAWAGYMLGSMRGLTIVTEPLFEQTIWRGYLANQVVYEAAVAASQSPGEAEAIKRLEPLFRNLDEATLHTWVESKLPIGPRIGVKGLPEEILAALAKWHLVSIQREREEKYRVASERRATWELRLKWLSFGIAGAGAVFSALKVLGVV